MEYDSGDGSIFDFEPNGIQFGSTLTMNISHPIGKEMENLVFPAGVINQPSAHKDSRLNEASELCWGGGIEPSTWA